MSPNSHYVFQLKEDNFAVWQDRIKDLFAEELSDFLEEDIPVPIDPSEKKTYLKNNQAALHLIKKSIGDQFIPYIKGCKSAYKVWSTLSDYLQENKDVIIERCKETLHSLKMNENNAHAYIKAFKEANL